MEVFSSLTGRAFLKDLLPLRLEGFWRLRSLLASRGRRFWREGCVVWAPWWVAILAVVCGGEYLLAFENDPGGLIKSGGGG